MKYMGSKRWMLKNGLGDILRSEAGSAARVVDLFCGGSSVSWFAATELKKPVIACDLQQYATTLAGAVVKRNRPAKASALQDMWLCRAARTRVRLKGWKLAREIDHTAVSTENWQRSARALCSSNVAAESSLIWRCYGGHYFSPTQALSFDAMLLALPKEEDFRELCLAATIVAASNCAAAPGHTAQPFKATPTAAKYLRESWERDPFYYAKMALEELCPLCARVPGSAVVGDANQIAKNLKPDDLVFVDPPYSGVQYSRFYHVLETISRRDCGEITGVGRYPPLRERPNSRYSRKGGSTQAIEDLLFVLAGNGCTVILTFPRAECSNGLSGDAVEEIARQFFNVECKSVRSRFSTLGGNTVNREARRVSDELMLVLKGK